MKTIYLLLLLAVTMQSKAQFFYQGACGSNAEFKVVYLDNDVFACTHFNSLEFYSIANPSNPTLITSVSLGFTFPVLAICRSGNHVFTQGYNSTSQFTVVDISNLNSPFVQGQCLWGNYTGVDIKVHNNFAYVMGYDSLYIYNISNLSAPTYFSAIDINGFPGTASMLIKNNQLCIGTSTGLSIYDINANGTLNLNTNLPQLNGFLEMVCDSLQENLFCSSTSNTNVYDFTQATNPVFKYQIPVGGYLNLKQNYLYSAESDSVNVTRINSNSYLRIASMGTSNLAPVYDIDAKDSSTVLVCSRDSVLTYSFNHNSSLGISQLKELKHKPYQLSYTSTTCELIALENQLKVELYEISGREVESFELQLNGKKQLQNVNPGVYFLRFYSNEKKQFFSDRIVLNHPGK